MVKEAYFGKDSITPDFLRAAEASAVKTPNVEVETEPATNYAKDFE